MHQIVKNNYKFLLIFFITLAFLISSCSQPAEDKKKSAQKTLETVQQEEQKEVPPSPEPAEREIEQPEKVEPAAPEILEIADPEPAKPIPAPPKKPEPATPKAEKKVQFPDIIKMENPAYERHKRGIVLFTHKKQVDDYKINCGQCHHDEKGVPLNDLKKDDQVDACMACHTKPGQAPRPKDKTKLSLKEKRAWHAEAIHQNCINCHKAYNKKNNTKSAPTSCSKCHPKGE